MQTFGYVFRFCVIGDVAGPGYTMEYATAPPHRLTSAVGSAR
jgi:hypothetical protein